ncbi:Dinitrogenase iron-molybdenum cofactor biosynthesis [Desulforamulus reducens MI-1]|uniref:Dinitrogenase iron-molybdenum cofactor biosynthesis n=1 Tax=Desulforamulus reducens (strain ATCC BAA-1160 / DSM 100696 / MI-1) TaxID=349161 RepID=A4J6N3_DESRM|nr:NifB/NifX family molybdenum-iron cluster-binding protein [Desulforamulus reducens]ABO50736.1 Dinitrogenase iron-molybdenum cofactor biosynthesis [Desulforamulus reducens MI-1]
MKICISSKGGSTTSVLDPRFGRAAYFILVDSDTMKTEVIENSAIASGGGAGIASGQLVVDKGVEVVITGNVGPNATKVLEASNVAVFRGVPATIEENIEKYQKGLLEKISTAVPAHFGMGSMEA